MGLSKTRIPFQASSTTDLDGLPKASEVVTLFNSVTAFGANNLQQIGDNYWMSVTIRCDKNTTGNSLTADFSNDGGTTWINFYTSTSNTPTGGTTFTDEIFIGMYSDVRLRFTNGSSKQTVFAVNLTLDDKCRSSANL